MTEYHPSSLSRGSRGRRMVPFGIVTALAVLGVFLPHTHLVAHDLAWSMTALGMSVGLAVVPLSRRPWWVEALAAAAYMVFVVFLSLGEGSVNSGSFSVALVPVLWAALYETRFDSAGVVVLAVAAITALSVLNHDAVAVTVRRATLWGVITAGVSIVIHDLRLRFTAVIHARELLLRQTQILSGALKQLTMMRTPSEVVDAAVALAAELVSPSSQQGRRALYLTVDGEVAHVVSEFDESGTTGPRSIPLSDHPALARVVETLQPVKTTFAPDSVRGAARESVAATGITHGAAVPVVVDGVLHGVLAVGGRHEPVRDLERLVDLGGITELALANALTNEELARQATTDALTGCANRRGLLSAIALLPSRRPFAVLAADLDNFKGLNDRLGHEEGDRALAHFADVLRRVVRTGDLIARVGGDEFVVVLHDGDEDAASRLASRILCALASSGDHTPAASLGVASGSAGTPFEVVWHEADLAMLRAKRSGGKQCAWASA